MNKGFEKIVLVGLIAVAYWLTSSLYGCGEGNSAASRVEAAEAVYNQLTDPEQADVQVSRDEMTTATQELAEAYLAYAAEQPDATDTPERLYKAAELFQINLLDINRAMEIYDRIIADFPDHKRAANSLFSKGYVFHNTMHDLDLARTTYTEFIEKYPDHDLVPHAQFELDNLGLSAKEALDRVQALQDSAQAEAAKDPS